MTRKVKVGDKLRVTSNRWDNGVYELPKGSITTVSYVTDGGFTCDDYRCFNNLNINNGLEFVDYPEGYFNLGCDGEVDFEALDAMNPIAGLTDDDFINIDNETVTGYITEETFEAGKDIKADTLQSRGYTREEQANPNHKEPYTFKVGDKGKTRGGYSYKVTAIGQDYLLAVIEDWEECVFYKSGMRETEYSQTISGLDLLPPTKRIKGWVNVYNSGGYIGRIYKTKEAALSSALGQLPVACIYIDIEEGEGL